jgi:hypothetical protein
MSKIVLVGADGEVLFTGVSALSPGPEQAEGDNEERVAETLRSARIRGFFLRERADRAA